MLRSSDPELGKSYCHVTRKRVMKGNKQTVNILASNWQFNLNTIKADSKGSKEEIYISKVKYSVKKGRPYIWVPEEGLHRVVKLAAESLRETISSERKAIRESTYSVSGILSSSNLGFTPRSENLQELLDGNEHSGLDGRLRVDCGRYADAKGSMELSILSCMYIDSNSGSHEVELEHVVASKADPLCKVPIASTYKAPFSSSLIDGINQSEMRRRALILFCITYLS
ncbi:Hemagglutinin-esterase-fusion glycoprotein chain 2 like [Actinidia chinensis var. chinensis]|uniref:Hemagglutinin-esterase-fusion glycoprotein chain 2 like n=1 Tax=Actinidia chinensis var. chinensis TaxID=1590841 RepID=A0A2R6RWZ6_ACTCC|nr:Hemagglutinin-esterase-fusion glycoprotein chain 2 like [Actinidia chinensis var. chinensis]